MKLTRQRRHVGRALTRPAGFLLAVVLSAGAWYGLLYLIVSRL